MKVINKIIFSIVIFCLSCSSFAQKFSDNEIGLNVEKTTKRLQERKVSEEDIKKEVAQLRLFFTNQHIEKQKQISNSNINNTTNLVLVSEPITLTAACPVVTGSITTGNTTEYCANQKIDFSFNFSSKAVTSYTYSWTHTDDTTYISNLSTPTLIFDYPGSKTIYLTITSSDGCIYKFQKTIFVNDCDSCMYNNPQTEIVKGLTLQLINKLALLPNGLVPNGYTCQELINLAPYITHQNPAIYDFYNLNGVMRFSFVPTHNDYSNVDVGIYYNSQSNLPIQDIIIGNYASSEEGFYFDIKDKNGQVFGGDDNYIRHIEFCPVKIDPCDTIEGQIVAQAPFCINKKIDFILQSTANIVSYTWTLTDLATGVVTTLYPNNNGTSVTYVFSSQGNYLITATVTDDIGCSTTFTYNINVESCTLVSCTKDNQNSQYVQNLLINLVGSLIQQKLSGNTDASFNGTFPPQLTLLAPFITDANPKIYNFSSSVSNGNINSISFSFSPEHLSDVSFQGLGNFNTVNSSNFQLDLSGYMNSESGISLIAYTYMRLAAKSINIKHIDFCPKTFDSCTKTNPNSAVVKGLFLELINHLKAQSNVPYGYTCAELTALAPYIIDIDPKIYNYSSVDDETQFWFHPPAKVDTEDKPDVYLHKWGNGISDAIDIDLSGFQDANEITNLDNLILTEDSSFVSYAYVKHINFCPDDIVYCAKTNPKTARVKELFKDLLNHLHQRVIDGLPIDDGYDCDELDKLRHYITDKDALIYNFNKEPFSFSFHESIKEEKSYDVLIDNWDYYQSLDVVDVDVSYYLDSEAFIYLNGKITLSNGSIIKNAEVRHINFCPDEICINHISLVLDESGSIDVYEKSKIKRQLNWFLKQQADINDLYQGNMYISIVGMSDKDTNERQDHIEPTRITNSNLSLFTNWVNAYGNRNGQPGISGGSDFWNSGLTQALKYNAETKIDMVIMITDGSQVATQSLLLNTMSKFNNRSQHYTPIDSSKPHLYVIGISNGFYVNGEQTTNAKLTIDKDPNFTPNLRSSSLSSRVTPALNLSLKYLFNLTDAEFPSENLINFNADYFGHSDFSFIGDELNEFYLSNNIKRVGIGCRKETPKDSCEDCYSFQPIPEHWYVLNAWAKEELNVQVQNYSSPKIKLNFYNAEESFISDVSFETKGEIIEGWQRIGNKFEVPKFAVFMEVELINDGSSVPVFFDDIRIYPVNGSMKSFVYDPETFRLMSELDENNYATYYEYDNEGGLVRVKKETVKGIKTIQETRSGNVIK